LVFISCDKAIDRKKKIAIAAAANLQFVIPELIEAFTKETGIACTVSISSSGKLTAQITEGAPFDLFLSADMYYPNYLFQEGFGYQEPEVYAKGILVLWSMEKMDLTIEELTDPEIKHIAIANPDLAPYGIPAKELLIKKGIWELVQDKLVFGESVSQTNQFIYTGVAEVGFTSKSSVLDENLKNKGAWKEIPPTEYKEISQGILVIKNSENIEEAKIFYNFIFSIKGREILKKYGYQV
jgi:molybdate transport system substrate-binding protein